MVTVFQVYNTLNRLLTGRHIRNTYLEAKLLKQLTVMREVVLHAICLHLHKAYDALDCDRNLEILEGYGV